MNKKIIMIFRVFFLLMITFALFNIISYQRDNKLNLKIKEKTNNYVKIDKNEEEKIDFQTLKQMNNDTVGYLKVNNTNIDYVIVKTTDNEYYLNHNFEKEQNVGGWIFVDYRNKLDETDRNIIIYGHNMKNGSMFGSLHKTLDKAWYTNPENQKIDFIMENKKYIYQIFSLYKVEVEDYYITTEFNTDSNYEKFLNSLKNRSIFNFNIDLDKNSNILTLSTCSKGGKSRVVLHAKKIK